MICGRKIEAVFFRPYSAQSENIVFPVADDFKTAFRVKLKSFLEVLCWHEVFYSSAINFASAARLGRVCASPSCASGVSVICRMSRKLGVSGSM